MTDEREKKNRKGVAVAIVTNTIYGLSFIFSKTALGYTTPAVMLVLRFGIALLVMLLLIAFRIIRIDLKGKPVLPLLLLGLFQPVIYFIFESYGIEYTNASFSGIMIALIPIISTIMSAIFLKEELKRSKLFWILCSVAGVELISVTESQSGAIQLKGVIFMVLAVLSASAFSIMSRSLSDKFTSFERTFVMMVLGFAAYVIMGLVQYGGGFAPAIAEGVQHREVIVSVLFLSVLSSVVAFFGQNYSISALNVQRAMVFANLAPVVSVIAGVLLLGEPFTPLSAAGGALIIVSIFMVNRE
jgi:drug/metabolite transporter (DMT)-like permease